MKIKDFVIFGSNATAALALGNNEDITWEHNLSTYYEVDQNEAVELVELGVLPDYAVERTYVRNKDNMDWIPDGFITLGASIGRNQNELFYIRRPDFTKILAPIAPDASERASPTLKLPTGDYLRVNKVNDVILAGTSASKTQAIAILRKYKAQDKREQEIVQNYGSLFGGLDSNAQMWHENATLSTGSANIWNTIIQMTLLKNELFAFNKIGICYPEGGCVDAGEVDKIRIYIDEQIEYNKYPAPPNPSNTHGVANMMPFVEGTYHPSVTETDSYGNAVIPRMYIFDKPLVVSRTYNKSLQIQLLGTVALAATNVPIYARACGIKYRLGV